MFSYGCTIIPSTFPKIQPHVLHMVVSKIKFCGFEQCLATQSYSLRFKPHCNYHHVCAVQVVVNHDQSTL